MGLVIPDFFDPRMHKHLRNLMTRDGRLSPEGWVVARLVYPDGSVAVSEQPNLVTDAGDFWYAQKAMTETPTNTFANCVLSTGVATPAKTSTYTNITAVAGSNKAVSATYPVRDDADVDNTGSETDAITWKFAWGAADFSATGILQGVITIAAPTTGSPLLAFWNFAASFAKDASTTLTLYVNHRFNGS